PAIITINIRLLNTKPRCCEGSVCLTDLDDCDNLVFGNLELDFCTDVAPFWDKKLPHNDAN
ncbi:MAG: hypothetical protein L0H35_06360, partial [Psychrobacter sp.]|nr:hypothetical protein [Psychrobacter sp.]